MKKEFSGPADFPNLPQKKHQNAILLGLGFLFFLFVAANLLPFWMRNAAAQEVLPVSLQAAILADYSASPHSQPVPVIDLGILRPVLNDRDPRAADIPARLATITAILGAPIATMTPAFVATLPETPLPSPSQTLHTATGTPTAIPSLAKTGIGTPTRASPLTATTTRTVLSTVTSPPVSTATPTWTRTPLPTKTVSPVATQPADTVAVPTLTASPASTGTSTSLPPATSSATPAPVPTATPTVTPTLTPFPLPVSTATPTASQTAAPTPTPTQTPTTTATATLTPTATTPATQTASPTAPPTPIPTPGSCNTYPDSGLLPLQDTWVDRTRPDSSYASDAQLHIRPSAGVDRRALVQFDLSAIPAGSAITGAVLYINDETGDNYQVQFLPVTSPWTDSVTWNTQPAFDLVPVGSFTLTPGGCLRAGYVDNATVQSWLDSPSTNYGLMLYPPAGAGEVLLTSMEGALKPLLVVSYTAP